MNLGELLLTTESRGHWCPAERLWETVSEPYVEPYVEPVKHVRPRPPIPERSCPNGHLMNAGNASWYKDDSREWGGYWRCLACRNAQRGPSHKRQRNRTHTAEAGLSVAVGAVGEQRVEEVG